MFFLSSRRKSALDVKLSSRIYCYAATISGGVYVSGGGGSVIGSFIKASGSGEGIFNGDGSGSVRGFSCCGGLCGSGVGVSGGCCGSGNGSGGSGSGCGVSVIGSFTQGSGIVGGKCIVSGDGSVSRGGGGSGIGSFKSGSIGEGGSSDSDRGGDSGSGRRNGGARSDLLSAPFSAAPIYSLLRYHAKIEPDDDVLIWAVLLRPFDWSSSCCFLAKREYIFFGGGGGWVRGWRGVLCKVYVRLSG